MIKHSCIALMAAVLAGRVAPAAAQNLELISENTGHRYVFYDPGKEPALAAKALNTLRLTLSPCANRLTVMDYSLQAQIYLDSEVQKTKHDGLHWSGKSERGFTHYIPRFTLAARNKPVEIGTVMVVEYFSQALADKDTIAREAVEHIPLVLTPKGQTLVFDGMGIKLYKAEFQGSNLAGHTSSSMQGKELLGVIVSLFLDGQLLYQQYSPAALSKFCSGSIPAPDMSPPRPPGPGAPAARRPPPWRRAP